jgi:hypothetical protein
MTMGAILLTGDLGLDQEPTKREGADQHLLMHMHTQWPGYGSSSFPVRGSYRQRKEHGKQDFGKGQLPAPPLFEQSLSWVTAQILGHC